MEALLLYSWENDKNELNSTKEWVACLSNELMRFLGLNAESYMLFRPKGQFKGELEARISNSNKIIIVLTESFCQRIQEYSGVSSSEGVALNRRIECEKNTHNIVYIKKDKVLSSNDWDDSTSFDFSWLTVAGYNSKSEQQRTQDLSNQIESLVRFLFDNPEYEIKLREEKQPIQSSSKTEVYFDDFLGLHKRNLEDKKEITVKDLIRHIQKNMDQGSFLRKYIQSGPSPKSNLGGYMTPRIFEDYFLVKRPADLDNNYKNKIRDLFKDDGYNMLCIQSDGGSGKTVFVNSLYLNDEKDGNYYKYEHCVVDFEFSNRMLISEKEELLQQRVKKLYRRMFTGNVDGQEYSCVWRTQFSKKLTELKDISLPTSEYNSFSLRQLEDGINEVVDILNLDPEAGYNELISGYSKRMTDLKSKLLTNEYKKCKELYFVILILLLIMLYNTRPQIKDKPERYIIVFDNIETFDAGNGTGEISRYVNLCHSTIEAIFDELGSGDEFKKKFTFVVALRISTVALFGDIATDIYNGNQNIITLASHDFTLEALLKKLRFLHIYVPGAIDSPLYKSLRNIVSVFIPDTAIDNCILNNAFRSKAVSFYASSQLLSLFNNNYRTATKYLGEVFSDENTGPLLIDLLSMVRYGNTTENFSAYLLNGARMIVISYIFKKFKKNGIFKSMGFNVLHGNEDHSLTRIILAYLYWHRTRYLYDGHKENNYKGVKLSTFLDSFKYFYDEKEITSALFDLSIYTRVMPDRSIALKNWGNLLVFSSKETLTENGLLNAVESYLHPEEGIDFEDGTNACQDTMVRLSQAGLCFTQYYIRSFEFLSIRDNDNDAEQALFAINDNDEVLKRIDRIYTILENCINKLLQSCEKTCKLYKGEGNISKCVMNRETPGPDLELFSCSLFLRFQECMDLIREGLDYIDRYRIVRFVTNSDSHFNDALLEKLKMYYSLYDIAKQKLREMHGDNKKIETFLSNWEDRDNGFYQRIIPGYYLQRARPVRDYYARHDENIEAAIEETKKHPINRIYDNIEEISKTKSSLE